MTEISAAAYKATMLPNQIMNNMLAMDTIQRDRARLQGAIMLPETVEYLHEIDRLARERLLKYHYYMAKAYEYRLLKPYTGALNLDAVTNQIVTLADNPITGHTLSVDQFNSIKALLCRAGVIGCLGDLRSIQLEPPRAVGAEGIPHDAWRDCTAQRRADPAA